MLLSPRKNGLTFLFKEVRVFRNASKCCWPDCFEVAAIFNSLFPTLECLPWWQNAVFLLLLSSAFGFDASIFALVFLQDGCYALFSHFQSVSLKLSTCSFCHLYFVKEFPRFGRNISAKIGSSQLISAKIGKKNGQSSTQIRLKNRLNLS